MARKAWMISPTKRTAKVPDTIKREVESKAAAIINDVLRPKHVRPPREDEKFNYISDIGSKWYRHYFYFVATYTCPGPNAIEPTFESKFARLEHLGNSRFAMYFMRHNGEWVGVYYDLTVDECIAAVQDDSWFHP